MITLFPVSAFQISVITRDASNNINATACVFTLQCVDTELPTAICPSDVNMLLPATSSGVNITWVAPILLDNCGIRKSVLTNVSGSFFSLGNHSVTCYVFDTSGNMGNCSFAVTVGVQVEPAAATGIPVSIVAASAGGIVALIVLIILASVLFVRSQQRKILALETAASFTENEESILLRAQAITEAFKNKGKNKVPNRKLTPVAKEAVFLVPSDTIPDNEMLESLPASCRLERSEVVIERELGSGEFGSVCLGYITKLPKLGFPDPKIGKVGKAGKAKKTSLYGAGGESSLYAPGSVSSANEMLYTDSGTNKIYTDVDQKTGENNYVVLDTGVKVPVAIKMLKKGVGKVATDQFKNEIILMAQFNHANIVRFAGYVVEGEPYLMCLELLTLGSLDKYLSSETVSNSLSLREQICFAIEVCAAFCYLHSVG